MSTPTPPSTESSTGWRHACVRALHPAFAPDGDLLTAIAEGLAAVTMPWELSAGGAPAGRSYERLLATASYDAWLIGWPPGSSLELHDHGTSAGAFAVVSGVLTEEAVVSGRSVSTAVPAGRSVSFAAGAVHGVANLHGTCATSVHVYAPPLSTMGFYRIDPEGLVHPVTRASPASWSTAPATVVGGPVEAVRP